MGKNRFLFFLLLPLFSLGFLISSNVVSVGVKTFSATRQTKNINKDLAANKLKDDYKLEIQSTLEIFKKTKILKVKINGIDYHLRNLLEDHNISKKGSELSGNAQKEFLTLLGNIISKEKLWSVGLDSYTIRIKRFFRALWREIKEKEEFKNLASEKLEVKIDDKEYNLANFFLQFKDNFEKKYNNLPNKARKIITNLFKDGIDKDKATNALEKLKDLEKYRLGIARSLNYFNSKYSSNIVDNFIFQKGTKIWSLSEIRKESNYDKSVYFLSFEARKELEELNKDRVNTKTIVNIWTNNLLENYRKLFETNLNNFRESETSSINFGGKNYSIKELIKPENKGQTAFFLSSAAKEELMLLHSYLVFITNPLEKIYLQIRDIVFLLSKAGITKISQGKSEYSIINLVTEVGNGKIFDNFSDNTKEQLKNLLDNKITNNQLIQAYKNFGNLIKDDLNFLLFVKKDKFTINQKKYETNNLKNIWNLVIPSQEIENEDTTIKLLEKNGLNHNKLFIIYKDAYLKMIWDWFELWKHLNVDSKKEIVVNDKTYEIKHLIEENPFASKSSFSELSSPAQEELVKLAIDMVSLEQWTIAVYTKGFRFIQPILKLFLEIKMYKIPFPHDRWEPYLIISHLSDHIQNPNLKLGKGDPKMVVSYFVDEKEFFSPEKLKATYDEKLDSFLKTIKFTLQKLASANIKTVTIDTNSYPISALTANLDIDGSKLTGDAKKELLDLIKNNLDPLIIKKKLDDLFSEKTSDFKKTIQTNLQLAQEAGITEAKIGNKTVLLKALPDINNINAEYAEMSSEAQKELVDLMVRKIDKPQLDTALENSLMEKYYLQIQKFFNTFAFDVSQVKIGNKTYSLDKLISSALLKQSVYLISPVARNQLKTLYDNQVSTAILFQTLTVIKKIFLFQKNWNAEKVSNYLLWLPVFNIKEVKLSQNQTLPVAALTTAIKDMLLAEKFDFTKLEGKAREELFNLLNAKSQIKEVKTFQDDVWKQIKNSSKWKAVEGTPGQLVLDSIRTLLLEVQELGIEKIIHPFFPEDYDPSFLKNNENWKDIFLKDLLAGMTIKKNKTSIEFYSHLFPNKVIFQVPMKKLDTIFSNVTIVNIIESLKETIATKLYAFKTDIQSSLNAYAKAKVNQFKFEGQVYQINYLIEDTNLNLVGSKLSQEAQIQLKILLKNNIFKQQLDETLVKILVLKEQQTQSTQDFKLKTLIISLASAGGFFILSSVVGGGVYLFTKSKK